MQNPKKKCVFHRDKNTHIAFFKGSWKKKLGLGHHLFNKKKDKLKFYIFLQNINNLKVK